MRADQTASCWGYNEYGQTDAPAGQFTAIAAGLQHSCAIKTDQTITCWNWSTNLPTGVSWQRA
ncbi:MAG: hypothetical protein F4015_00900 [Acidimicrobiia bacterium]|nr:hypothetical protein [Acidimicrobiia bacterium]